MGNQIAQIALIVEDYDEAIAFYTEKLHFELIEDTILSESKRWVVVAPKNSDCQLLLAKASNEVQKQSIGNQTGGRVFLFLNTDDFEKEHQNLIDNQIVIERQPSVEPYGKVLVFKDLYGNLWDLIEPKKEEENHYYSTAILKIKDGVNKENVIVELKKLQYLTKKEKGNFLFDVHFSTENPIEVIIWEGFYTESDFKNHLNTVHLKDFLRQNLVDFISGYPSNKMK